MLFLSFLVTKLPFQNKDLHKDIQIMDGGRSSPRVKIEPCDLLGHITILNGKDYADVQKGWAGMSDSVFMQRKAH